MGEPDHDETLLLRVCFLPPVPASEIWDRHGVDVRIEDLRPEAHGLLPLLHRRLVELDRRPPSLEKLHGIRRRLWVQNELRLRAAREALDVLAAVDTRGALLGGAGILVGHLAALDLRPLHDLDVLVSGGAAATSGRGALERGGWVPGPAWRDGYLLDVEACRFTDPNGRTIVLRWSSAPSYVDAVERAVPVATGAGAFEVVEPADLLLHVLLDGARAMPSARVRWASDSLAVIRSGAPVDWSRVASGAAGRGAGATVSSAIDQLDRLVPLGLGHDARVALASPGRPWWGRVAGADAAGPATALRARVRRRAIR